LLVYVQLRGVEKEECSRAGHGRKDCGREVLEKLESKVLRRRKEGRKADVMCRDEGRQIGRLWSITGGIVARRSHSKTGD
jgi:hypothetical protein